MQQSSGFNLEHSEEIRVSDLHLMNKEILKTEPANIKTYVGTFQEVKKPLSEELKPYIQAFMAKMSTSAGVAAVYGHKTLQVLGKAIWWGYQGMRGLFNKTTEYIQPKFLFVTANKGSQNKEQLQALGKMQQDIAVLGLDEYNQLKPVQNGKYQMAMPIDDNFIDYLKKENIQIKDHEWEPNLDERTRTMIIPREAFEDVIRESKTFEVPKVKSVIKYGNFCMFNYEGENEIEYQCIKKLRLSGQQLEGYLMAAPPLTKVESIQSDSSAPAEDNEAMLTEHAPAQVKSVQLQVSNGFGNGVKSVECIQMIPQYNLDSIDQETNLA